MTCNLIGVYVNCDASIMYLNIYTIYSYIYNDVVTNWSYKCFRLLSCFYAFWCFPRPMPILVIFHICKNIFMGLVPLLFGSDRRIEMLELVGMQHACLCISL